jgi:SagB-type dehydrogenase family enzyme
MSKALWVGLPIVLFFALVLALAALRKPPSRLAINVTSSLLLLAYVAVTAALGVFWVANQQLPAFDWHYLFGYGTVLLLVVHLALNLRVVVAYLRRRRPTPSEGGQSLEGGQSRGGPPPAVLGADAPAGGAAPRSLAAASDGGGTSSPTERPGAKSGVPSRSRLPLGGVTLAVTGMLLAFGLGVRHGNVEVRLGSSTSPGPGGASWAAVEEYHALSSHSTLGLLRRAPGVDWGDAPPPKTYPSARRTALPPPAEPAQPRSVTESMRGPSAPRTEPLDLAALASILHHTSGVTHVRGGLQMRAAPSSGALFPAEVYIAVRDGEAGTPGDREGGAPAVAAGLYHFDPLAPALERLGDPPAAAALGVETAALADAPAVAFVTAILRRTGQKYRDRAYRYAAADVGHLLENLSIAAAEHGLSADPLPAFDDAAAASALGVDGVEEVVLGVVPLTRAPVASARSTSSTLAGSPGPAGSAAPAAPRATAAARGVYLPVDISSNTTLGITGTVHAATSLRRVPAIASDLLAAAGPAVPLPTSPPAPGTALTTIAARESRRSFAPPPLPLSDLAAVLTSATSVSPRLSTAVSVHVVANRVDSLSAGAHLLAGAPPALVPIRLADLRQGAFTAALSQDVIGNAAAVVVLAVDVARLRAEGPRAYRHAYLDVGMLGERIVLEATARGLGVCPVGAFYDDDAAALIGVDPGRTWVAHFIAVGPLPP